MTISKLSEQNSHCEILKSNNQSIFVFNDLQSILVDSHAKQLSDMEFLDSQSGVAVKGKIRRVITDFFTSKGDVSKRLAPNDAKEAPFVVADVECIERKKKICEAADSFTSQGDVSRLAPNDAKGAPSDVTVADVECSERKKKIREAAELVSKYFQDKIR